MQVFGAKFNNDRVQVQSGTIFEVALPEQPTTGYRWTLASTQLPVSDSTQVQDRSLGGPAVRHFRFCFDGREEKTILFELHRSWQPSSPPAETFTLHVEVR
jgi:predicted secreted protein